MRKSWPDFFRPDAAAGRGGKTDGTIVIFLYCGVGPFGRQLRSRPDRGGLPRHGGGCAGRSHPLRAGQGWIAQGTTEDARPLLGAGRGGGPGAVPPRAHRLGAGQRAVSAPGHAGHGCAASNRRWWVRCRTPCPKGWSSLPATPWRAKKSAAWSMRTAPFSGRPTSSSPHTERNTPRGIAFRPAAGRNAGLCHIAQLSCAEHDWMIGCQPADPRHRRQPDERQRQPAPVRVHGRFLPGPHPHCPHQRAFVERIVPLNRDALCAEIEQFEASLTDLKEKPQAGDEEGLKDLFRRPRHAGPCLTGNLWFLAKKDERCLHPIKCALLK